MLFAFSFLGRNKAVAFFFFASFYPSISVYILLDMNTLPRFKLGVTIKFNHRAMCSFIFEVSMFGKCSPVLDVLFFFSQYNVLKVRYNSTAYWHNSFRITVKNIRPRQKILSSNLPLSLVRNR